LGVNFSFTAGRQVSNSEVRWDPGVLSISHPSCAHFVLRLNCRLGSGLGFVLVFVDIRLHSGPGRLPLPRCD